MIYQMKQKKKKKNKLKQDQMKKKKKQIKTTHQNETSKVATRQLVVKGDTEIGTGIICIKVGQGLFLFINDFIFNFFGKSLILIIAILVWDVMRLIKSLIIMYLFISVTCGSGLIIKIEKRLLNVFIKITILRDIVLQTVTFKMFSISIL